MTDTPENNTEDKTGFVGPERRFFGRRKGKPLSGRKQSMMDELLPRLSVTVPEGDTMIDPAALFGAPKKELWLEIGFGKGEHLAWQAQAHPDVGLIGCEPYLNGVAGLLAHIEDNDIQNIRIYGDDARHVIWKLPDASVDRVFLLHPDPWPKTRHARRRFVGRHNLDDLARIMKDGAEFRVGTDHPIYREWTALQMSGRTDFEWLANGPEDWLTRPDDWPETRYEAKALEGRATYFRFRRVPRG
ncbi:tRNA (guanine(46)-N(7))-methyltransferase TrmB [Kordiimonas marina]|uniref:tRNA (guanine(46)-N(7))-methyltransferase TrmB n=1 Tax=Kordiimonas marina TaxID=2872312 RepID=UPI001FF1D1C8|nr:tRNA (guanine(46)-N(7))-methyltransferase TrmB [Kordiimonas marina]MCJ9428258.1 tRNA (guanine(46)-N(7))-methyltransferase TrmB [Kordiimonas marina]